MPSPEEVLREHGVLMRELEAGGKYRSSNALGPVETATTVRVREGKTNYPLSNQALEELGDYDSD